MVNTCCITGCTSRSNKSWGINFFRIPAANELRRGRRFAELAQKRRREWFRKINRNSITEKTVRPWARVCSLHFHSGRPADTYDDFDPDWVPSLNLGYDSEDSSSDMGSGYVREKKKENTSSTNNGTSFQLQEKIFFANCSVLPRRNISDVISARREWNDSNCVSDGARYHLKPEWKLSDCDSNDAKCDLMNIKQEQTDSNYDSDNTECDLMNINQEWKLSDSDSNDAKCDLMNIKQEQTDSNYYSDNTDCDWMNIKQEETDSNFNSDNTECDWMNIKQEQTDSNSNSDNRDCDLMNIKQERTASDCDLIGIKQEWMDSNCDLNDNNCDSNEQSMTHMECLQEEVQYLRKENLRLKQILESCTFCKTLVKDREKTF